jgi:hypothetical protein
MSNQAGVQVKRTGSSPITAMQSDSHYSTPGTVSCSGQAQAGGRRTLRMQWGPGR